MACCHPYKRFLTGGLTENGKPDGVLCMTTTGNLLSVGYAERRKKIVYPSAPLVEVNGKLYLKDPQAIPCGKCVGCRMDKARVWKVRVCHEMKRYPPDQCHFVTLTYRDGCVPTDSKGRYTLRKKDAQEFLNHLRNPCIRIHRHFRYFGCGEYGTAEYGTHRPHFHFIIFGPIDDLVPFAPKRAHSAMIERAWPHGLSEVSPVYPETIAYVAGYVEKKQVDPNYDEYPVKPFLMMSTKPAIGSNYLPELGDPTVDRKVYGDFGGSHSAGIPRAYLKKCEKEPWFKGYKERSAEIARKTLDNNLAACRTTDEEKLGDVQELAANRRLKKLRKVTL